LLDNPRLTELPLRELVAKWSYPRDGRRSCRQFGAEVDDDPAALAAHSCPPVPPLRKLANSVIAIVVLVGLVLVALMALAFMIGTDWQ
jgi:hypothetical protein